MYKNIFLNSIKSIERLGMLHLHLAAHTYSYVQVLFKYLLEAHPNQQPTHIVLRSLHFLLASKLERYEAYNELVYQVVEQQHRI
jgi:hypothetical protein